VAIPVDVGVPIHRQGNRAVASQCLGALRLDDADLTGDFPFTGSDGRRYRWRLLDLLTQVFGHAWCHRGQVAMLVHDLGGKAIDTDYIFWHRPTPIGA
jgi:uncharacterized damage-inducible protein DinB